MFDSIVAKEGHKKILVAFIAFLIFVILECGLLALISFAAFAFLIYAYRYKYIDFKSLSHDEIFAPISGKITAIDVKDFKKSIYIDVSLCDSHILRSLDSGSTKSLITRGLNLSTASFKAKKLNERATIEYQNCSMQLLSSMCNDSINIPCKTEFSKGEKLGIFLQGQVIVTLDSSYETVVNISDKIESGMTVLARVKK